MAQGCRPRQSAHSIERAQQVASARDSLSESTLMNTWFGLRFAGLRHMVGAIGVLVLVPFAAHGASLEELVSSVVRIKTFINPEGRTVADFHSDL